MNFIHLKYAVEIEKAGSVSKAAENLFMGQPNLSKAIKELENEIGVTIFFHTPRGVARTEQGKEFLKKAKELVRETKMSCDEIAKQVGLCDETYLRKRFKAFFGVSISRFRNIDNELTLYHDKPVRKNS